MHAETSDETEHACELVRPTCEAHLQRGHGVILHAAAHSRFAHGQVVRAAVPAGRKQQNETEHGHEVQQHTASSAMMRSDDMHSSLHSAQQLGAVRAAQQLEEGDALAVGAAGGLGQRAARPGEAEAEELAQAAARAPCSVGEHVLLQLNFEHVRPCAARQPNLAVQQL